MQTNEYLLSTAPIVVRRRVLWSECDPAQVVYTGRFFDYLASCFGWFLRNVVDVVGDGAFSEQGLGTPMRAISLEFEKMLRPGDWFEMRLAVTAIKTRTFDIRINATDLTGATVFIGRLTPIIVAEETKASVPIPAFLRSALERYQAASQVDT